MANTSIVSRIGIHSTAETALPTLPSSAGTNVTVSAWGSAGFLTVNSVNLHSDDFDIDEDTWNWSVEERVHETSAPISDGVDDAILLGRKLNDIEIKLYDISETLLTKASDIAVASNVATWASSFTNRSVGIEINKTAMFFFPKSVVRFTDIEMGAVEGQVARATMMIKPLNVSGKPGGWNLEWY
jgi:hypothetical protein